MTYHQSKRTAFADAEKGGVALSLSIIFGLILLSVFYLVQVNGTVAKNFELRAIQSALEEKQGANQQAMVLLMRARALSNLENAAKDLNLVAVEKVSYLKIVPEFFALSQNP